MKNKELEKKVAESKIGGGKERIEAQHKKGKLTARERRLWYSMSYEWMSVVRRTVVEEKCSPQHKQGWLTYDDDDDDSLLDSFS